MGSAVTVDDAFEYEESSEWSFEDEASVGTMDVQLLLSWFFESSTPTEFDMASCHLT
jgi:hypothetical protein